MGSIQADTECPYFHVDSVKFSLYSANEIQQLSVKEVTNPQTFDALLHPTYGGLHDPAFGPIERDELCATCGLNNIFCPGHMGHIVLPMPVYNPVFFNIMLKLLRGSCFACHRLRLVKHRAAVLRCRLRLLEYGLLEALVKLNGIYDEFMGGQSSKTNAGASGDDKTVVNDRVLDDVLEDCVTQSIKDININDTCNSGRVKNLEALRQGYFKEFLSGAYYNKSKCPTCNSDVKNIRTEHHTKVFFYKTLAKKQKISKAAQERKLKEMEIQRSSADVDDDPTHIEVDEVIMDTATPPPQTQVEPSSNLNSEAADMSSGPGEHAYLTPQEVQSHLRQVWHNDRDILEQVFKVFHVISANDENPIDAFFINVLPVCPPRFRPLAVMGEQRFENPQTANMCKVLKDKINMQTILHEISQEKESTITPEATASVTSERPARSANDRLNVSWLEMQTHVNALIDSDLDRLSTDKLPGIKQLLEKKAGLFRKHMMGKRVNFAARSVISPDPYISTNEIGIPLVFATKLTYPTPVTPWNFQELKTAVINGPNVHPGATHVVEEDGTKIVLKANDSNQREALAKQLLTPSNNRAGTGCKQVLRHLKKGDILLLNRQPTLHRPSIQAHKARILPGEKTLRLHYSNCKAYNADFDGDEMNAHFPQDEISRAEAYGIACTDWQYLVPKDGSPLAGLIQDHMVSGVNLMIRGRFFDRADYQQLVYCALTDKSGPVKTLPPAMRKPKMLWSGKQVLSSVLLNIIPDGKPPLHLTGRAKVPLRQWINGKPRPWIGGSILQGENMSETEVVIRSGELLVGVLDKAHYGNTSYGLVHSCYELYGGAVAGQLLTALAKLFTTFLQYRGFTLGVEDILCTVKGDKKRRKVMVAGQKGGHVVAAKAFSVADTDNISEIESKMKEAHYDRENNTTQDLDLCMKGMTDEIQNEIAKHIMPLGLLKRFPHNNLQLMVQAGAKGSSVNCMQISCLLGQIELEGHRPPLMLNGRSLPSFQPFDMSARAGGFIDGRFLTGIRPQEYFFHCMAGREGLIDTAVKTSRSGYLQRCLIKHLEGLCVSYDLAVRDSDGSVVQFQYGEDGLDVVQTPYLRQSQFSFLIENHLCLASEKHLNTLRKNLNTDASKVCWKQYHKWKSNHRDASKQSRISPFLKFCWKKWKSVEEVIKDGDTSTANFALHNAWASMSQEKKQKYVKHTSSCPDPVNVLVSPVSHLGAVSERMEELIETYLDTEPHMIIGSNNGSHDKDAISSDHFRQLMYMRNLEALVAPGEAVGLLAAQSIGEPSTQMTLNTFHFAGRGEMNVTLGIPRLREILMVASSKIKTPAMDVPLLRQENQESEGKKLKLKLTKVYLSQVVEEAHVTESIAIQESEKRCRSYTIRLTFLPHDVYRDDLYVNPSRVLADVEKRFFPNLVSAVNKKYKDIANSSLLNTAVIRTRSQASAGTGQDEDVEEDDQNDDDATAKKQREKQMEDVDYDGEDEERNLVDQESGSDDDEGIDVMSGEEEEDSGDEGAERTGTATPRKKKHKEMSTKRLQDVVERISAAKSYKYDATDELWCELVLEFPLRFQTKIDMTSVLEEEIRKMVLYQTPGLKRAFLSQSKKIGEEGIMRMKTEGVNLEVMAQFDKILDLNQLYTNDIHKVSKYYGIEAARQTIVKEVRDVFGGYGIDVDYRHLSLVADYMTFEGEYKAFNRFGMTSNASALQKMTFETTMSFLRDATVDGASDNLTSPSARLVLGQLVKGGTGAFDLVQSIT